MIGRNRPEDLLKKITKLDTIEFLGVCRILGVELYEEENYKRVVRRNPGVKR